MAMKRVFDFTFVKSLQIAWLQRCQSIFSSLFGKRKPLEAPSVVKVQASPQSSKSLPPSPPTTQKPATVPPQQTITTKKEMHSSVAKSASIRLPMIKFIGARLPRPFFDPTSLPPLSKILQSVAPAVSAPAKAASSIGPVGKIPRGQGIDQSQLPSQFRRSQLSEEECEAINAGFFYQR